MAHTLFVINAGSSSIKYKVFEFEGDSNYEELAEGKIEKIGEDKSIISHNNLTNDSSIKKEQPGGVKDHHEAIEKIIELLTTKDEGLGVLASHNDVAAVGHRLVHGGDDPRFVNPTKVDESILEELRGIQKLAPLHTAANLTGIESVTKLFKNVPQYIVCDTSFHSTLPPVAYRYAVPDDWFSEHKIRKYGFHGISHLYVAKRYAKYLSRPLEDLNLITIHLGNGSSVACIKNGKSVDTSMGFTPLAGLVMGSRSGDLDAGALDYYATKTNTSVQEIVKLLNSKSGMKGLCGTNDMREVIKMMSEGNEKAKLAFDMVCYSIKKYLGQYFFVLGGKVDGIIFTGGIGENSHEVRAATLAGLEQTGIRLDQALNERKEETKGKKEKKEKKDKKDKEGKKEKKEKKDKEGKEGEKEKKDKKDKKDKDKKDKKEKKDKKDKKNKGDKGVRKISEGEVPVFVVETNEELEIALQVYHKINTK